MVALLRCNRKIVEIFSSLLLCVLAVFKTHSMLNLLFLITTKLLLLCWLCSTYDVLNMPNWKSVCEVVCWRCSLMWLVHWRILKNCDWTATISSTSPVWVTHTSYKPPPHSRLCILFTCCPDPWLNELECSLGEIKIYTRYLFVCWTAIWTAYDSHAHTCSRSIFSTWFARGRGDAASGAPSTETDK